MSATGQIEHRCDSKQMEENMTRDVLITISGLHLVDEEGSEPVEIITAGKYYYRKGKHYIRYDEVTEGSYEKTRSQIKIGENGVEVRKQGASDVHMIFEKNKKNLSSYQTPYGSLMMGMDTKKLSIDENPDAIDVRIEYDLEINYEHLAECSLMINIKSKAADDFSL
jgi:uncharacterized beta-barrel protein YwiB (DUF1934 family)